MKSSQYLLLEEHSLTVQSGKLKIKNIQVFDVLKKTTKPNSLIIVKVTLENNSEETRKVIY
jgi:hypothetical protein